MNLESSHDYFGKCEFKLIKAKCFLCTWEVKKWTVSFLVKLNREMNSLAENYAAEN